MYKGINRGLLNCGLRAAGHRLHCGLWVTDCGLQVAGHTQVAVCGPQIVGCGLRATLRLRAMGHRLQVCWLLCCGLRATDCGLRATCCGLLKLLVAKLQVAKMSCCRLLNYRLRFPRLFRLSGCQLLDLSGYNMWVTGCQKSENYSLLAKELNT